MKRLIPTFYKPARYCGLGLLMLLFHAGSASSSPDEISPHRPEAASCGVVTECRWTQLLTDGRLGYWPMPRHMAVDASGNIYWAGESYHAGGEPGAEIMLAKHDKAGKLLWVQRFSGRGGEYHLAYGIAVDESGNICIGGRSDGAFNAGNARVGGGFVARYDTHGERLWAANHDTEVFAVVQDHRGNCYAASRTRVTRYDDKGAAVWSYKGDILDLAANPKGMFHIIGQQRGSPYLVTLDEAGEPVGRFELKLGEHLNWPRLAMRGYLLKIDRSGDLFIQSNASGVDRQGKSRVGPHLVRMSRDGKVLWERYYEPEGDIWSAFDFALDRQGNAFQTGNYKSLKAGSSNDAFVIKYAPNGDLRWVRKFGTPLFDGAGSISVDGSGNYVIVGATAGDLDGQIKPESRRTIPYIARNRP